MAHFSYVIAVSFSENVGGARTMPNPINILYDLVFYSGS